MFGGIRFEFLLCIIIQHVYEGIECQLQIKRKILYTLSYIILAMDGKNSRGDFPKKNFLFSMNVYSFQRGRQFQSKIEMSESEKSIFPAWETVTEETCVFSSSISIQIFKEKRKFSTSLKEVTIENILLYTCRIFLILRLLKENQN